MTDELKKYFNGDELASSVWLGKYALKEETTPDDMHRRMAKEFARIEKNYPGVTKENFGGLSELGKTIQAAGGLTIEDIYHYFQNFRYIVPQGSIMSMLGNRGAIGSLSNCFVVGQPFDSYGGIFQKDQQLAQLMKRRGGVGIDISTLRPSTAPVSNAAGSSTGAISFMHRYSNTTREVAQNGRRGALMISIDCRHPDVLDFIKIKADLTKVTGANISVQLRDDFMQAVKEDKDYQLRFPCDSPETMLELPYNELKVYERHEGGYGKNVQKVYYRRVKAREYFLELIKNNWLSAEPGSIFVDRHWNYSPDGVYKQYRGVTTNPCGEIFMQMYDACRLLALNFYSFVKEPFTRKAQIDFEKLYEVAYVQQRLADNLVDLELEHIERIITKIKSDSEPDEVKQPELELWQNIYKTAKAGRRTGCGFTGLGDMLAALGLKYDSDEAKEIIDQVMKVKLRGELDCTVDLAIERGTFEGWSWKEEYWRSNPDMSGALHKSFIGRNVFYKTLAQEFPVEVSRMIEYGRRNVSWSTVAPTGTVSLLTQTTSGLEPLFAPYYFRNKKGNPGDTNFRVDFVDQNGDAWMVYPILHFRFREWLSAQCDSPDTLTKDQLSELFKKSPWFGSCANDIDWLERVKIQGIIQKYTTHSISSTINLPNEVSKDKVYEIYMRAWEHGLKGVTIYRDGCRTGVLVTDNKKEEKGFEYHDAPKRPKDLNCDIFTTVSQGKKWNIVVGLFSDKPFEVFAVPHFTSESEGILTKVKKGRYDLLFGNEEIKEDITASMTDEESALTRLISTALRHGSSIDFIVEQLHKSHGSVVSFNKAIARILTKYAKRLATSKEKCSDCGSESIVREEGCLKCTHCGSSKCG